MIGELTKLHNQKDTLNGIVNGMKKVNDLVSPTMGSLGRFVIIEMPDGNPLVINDGVHIAQRIELEDKLENLGARLNINAMEKTARKAGDSTSLTCNIMTNLAILSKDYIEMENLNPVPFARGMREQATEISKYISSKSKVVETEGELFNVGFIASRNEKISNLIVEAVVAVGDYGIIQRMRSYKNESYLELIKGMVLEYGILSPRLLLKKDREIQMAEMHNVRVLMLSDKLIYQHDISKILNYFYDVAKEHYEKKQEKLSLLIIAQEYSEQVIDFMVSSKNNTYLKYVEDFQAVLTPGISKPDMEDNLQDVESLTLGKIGLIKTILNGDTNSFNDYLGKLEEVAVRLEATILKGNKNDEVEKSVESRIKILKNRLDNKDITKNEMTESELKARISKLNGGIAVLRIFGATEIEYQDLMEKSDDALRTVRTAQEGGIITGGGNTLKSAYFDYLPTIIKEIDDCDKDDRVELSYLYGKQALIKILIEPFLQICENAGIENPVELFANLEQYETSEEGINVSSWKVVDLFDEGIIDATNSIIYALNHAVANVIMAIRIAGGITLKIKG